jgi:peptidoglycan/LPS O-acetylase OafA/YrhL
VQRLDHLDGLRGIAAISVAVFHFLRAFKPELVSPHIIAQTPISSLWNGHFAVHVFFALSGFLFFGKLYGKSPVEGVIAGAKRYARLTLPIIPVSLLAWGLHTVGGFHNTQAAILSGSDWLGRWYQFQPNLWLAIAEPILGMYVSFDPLRTYNSNLWTISYELFMVWAVISLAIFSGRAPLPITLCLMAVIAWASGSPYLLTFLLGAIVWLAVRGRTQSPALGLLAVFVGLWMGCAAQLSEVMWPIQWPLGAALVLLGSCLAPSVKNALSTQIAVHAAKLSFGIYLVHFLTVNSFASWAFINSGSIVVTALVYAASTLVGAVAFFNLIDRPVTIAVNKMFKRIRISHTAQS